MSTISTDVKIIANTAYNAAVVCDPAVGYARLERMIIKDPVTKLDFTGYDTGMMILDVGLAMATIYLLIKQGILPDNILKY